MNDNERERLRQCADSITKTEAATAKRIDWSAARLKLLAAAIDPESEKRAAADAEERKRLERLAANLDRFYSDIGIRYHGCRLENFEVGECSRPETMTDNVDTAKDRRHIQNRRTVVARLEKFAAQSCRNLILIGPEGVGKDHLLTSVCRTAIIDHDRSVRWVNGLDLAAMFRDAITARRPERAVIDLFIRCDILAISDPVPPHCDASEYHLTNLYRIIDLRYRNERLTWITMNAAKSAKDRLPAAIRGRLRDDAIVLNCDWESYREAK